MQPAAITRWISSKPLTTVLLIVVVFTIARTIASFVPVRPLETLQGFDEAVASITDHTTFVVVSPPDQPAALDHIPPGIMASDGMPPTESARARYSSITLIAPRGSSLPLSAQEDRRTFGEVDVVRYRTAP